MATKKRIVVKGVGGVKLSNDAEFDKWLRTQSVACLLDNDGDQILGFQSLATGGTYTLGPPIQQPQQQEQQQQQHHQALEFSAEQINALAAFAQEEMDNRTKHKPMSEASVPFANSILAGNGIQTVVEAPILESGSLADPPKFSWEVVDSDGQVWNKSEQDGTSEVVKWANKHLLAGEKEYGLKVVTGAKLPMVKGNRKSAAGKGDIAIGELVNMKYGETFTFVNGLVELKTDRSSLKTGQNLLELFALSMTSKFGRGVALLATNCNETWETFHFSQVGVIIRRFYDHGGKAWEEFMKLIKSAEERQLQSIPPASLAAIKEDDKDEQNLGGFDIPAHERKKQRALDDHATLERVADHLGALYGERPVVPLWAQAESRIPDYYV